MAATKHPKVAKVPSTASKKPPPTTLPKIKEQDPALAANMMDFTDPLATEMQPLDSFASLMEDPLPDMSFDDLLSPSQNQWPWSDTQDWTLMDESTDSFAAQNFMHQTIAEHESDLSLLHNPGLVDDIMRGHNMRQAVENNGGSGNRMLWEHLRSGQLDERPQEKQEPTHTAHVHDADIKNWYAFDCAGGGAGVAVGAATADFYASDEKGERRRSLALLTLRLIGMAKAVKAFGNLLQQRSLSHSELRSISLGRVAPIAWAGLDTVQNLHANQRANGFLVEKAQQQHASLYTVQNLPANQRINGSLVEQALRKHASLHTDGFLSDPNQPPLFQSIVAHGKLPLQEASRGSDELDSYFGSRVHSEPAADGPLEGMTTDDYLRTKTNFSDTEKSGRGGRTSVSVPKVRRTQEEFGVPATGVEGPTSEGLGMNPAPSSSSGVLEDQHATAAQEGRQGLSLGEGITGSASPSTELFMLKRRIPKTLHSIVDRSNNTAPTPLLQKGPGRTESTVVNATQVNGSAYQRVDSGFDNAPTLTGLSAPLQAEKPAHARSRDPTASDFRGDTDQQPMSGIHANVLIAARVAINPEPQLAQRSEIPSCSQWSSQRAEVYDDRLSDHMRRRDHFGRQARESWREVMGSVVAIGGLLMLLSMLPTTTTNLSLLLLALVSPVPDKILQCTTKNSSWLLGVHQHSQNHAPARKYIDTHTCGHGRYIPQAEGEAWWKGSGKKDGPIGV